MPKSAAQPAGRDKVRSKKAKYDSTSLESLIATTTGCAVWKKVRNGMRSTVIPPRGGIASFKMGQNHLYLHPNACKVFLQAITVDLSVNHLMHKDARIEDRIAWLSHLRSVNVDKGFTTVVFQEWNHAYASRTEEGFWRKFSKLIANLRRRHFWPTRRHALAFFRKDIPLTEQKVRCSIWDDYVETPILSLADILARYRDL